MFVIFNALSIWMVAPFVSTLFESQETQVEQEIASEPQEEVSFFDLNEWLKSKIDHLFKRTDKIETVLDNIPRSCHNLPRRPSQCHILCFDEVNDGMQRVR